MDAEKKREQYKRDLLILKEEWNSENEEFMLVTQLGYWTYWLSKYAEKTDIISNRNQLFKLKHNCLTLLNKSNHTELRKYEPLSKINKKLCEKHRIIIKEKNFNVHWYLENHKKEILECKDCQADERWKYKKYYSLYSLAILNKENKVQFILYVPFPVIKDNFPPLKNLRPVKFFKGEYGRVEVSTENTRSVEKVFSTDYIFQQVLNSYTHLTDYKERESNE